MGRRSHRFEPLPPDMAADVLRAAGAFRGAVIRDVLARTTPFGSTYKAALAVVDAIDGLAEALTGHRDHFHLSGSSPDFKRPPR